MGKRKEASNPVGLRNPQTPRHLNLKLERLYHRFIGGLEGEKLKRRCKFGLINKSRDLP
jgi:hypothetical protein